MYSYYSPIYNFKSEDNLIDHDIWDKEKPLNLISEVEVKMFGISNCNDILSMPSLYKTFQHSIQNEVFFLNQLSSDKNAFFAFGLWMIKDNSVFSPHSYLFSFRNKRPYIDNRNIYLSNSRGRYSLEVFSKEELDLAKMLFDKLLDLFFTDPQDEFKPVVSGTVVTSPYNLVNHNLFNRINRAMNFILLARSNSHILTKISWYIVALEALFISGSDGDTSYRLRCRVSLYLGKTRDEKDSLYDVIKNGYSLRSSYLHGDNINNKFTKSIDPIDVSVFLDDILRQTILKIINNENNDQEIFLDPKKKESYFHSLIFD